MGASLSFKFVDQELARAAEADAGEGERLYTLTVCYQQHRWARLFGLSTTSQVSRIHPLIPRTGL